MTTAKDRNSSENMFVDTACSKIRISTKKTEVAKKNERTTEEECGIFRPRRTEEQTKEVAKVVMDEVWGV